MLFIMSCQISYGQDTILFLDGKTLIAKVLEYKKDYISIEKGNRHKQKWIEAKEVFSVTGQDGIPKVIYTQDKRYSNSYTPEQMKKFIEGGQFAKKRYHAPWAAIFGIIIGAGSSPLGLYCVPVPAFYTFIVNIKNPTPRRYKDLSPGLKNDPYFKEGFRRKASSKKTNTALISGYLSAAAALAALVFLKL